MEVAHITLGMEMGGNALEPLAYLLVGFPIFDILGIDICWTCTDTCSTSILTFSITFLCISDWYWVFFGHTSIAWACMTDVELST